MGERVQTLSPKNQAVNSRVIDSVCHECRRFRSRRGAIVAHLGQRNVFICASCCERLYSDGLGYDHASLEFFLQGGAA